MILDIGPKSVVAIEELLGRGQDARLERPVRRLRDAALRGGDVRDRQDRRLPHRDGKLKAIAGGGDTVAALNQAGVAGEFTYVSTAGGAFLEWMEGKALPGVEALRAK